jgi:hypothetical protein
MADLPGFGPISENIEVRMLRYSPIVQKSDQVDFALKELRLGRGWYIVATHPSGQQENIDGFHCEAEAREWIEGSRALQSWLRTRGYGGYERAA